MKNSFQIFGLGMLGGCLGWYILTAALSHGALTLYILNGLYLLSLMIRHPVPFIDKTDAVFSLILGFVLSPLLIFMILDDKEMKEIVVGDFFSVFPFVKHFGVRNPFYRKVVDAR